MAVGVVSGQGGGPPCGSVWRRRRQARPEIKHAFVFIHGDHSYATTTMARRPSSSASIPRNHAAFRSPTLSGVDSVATPSPFEWKSDDATSFRRLYASVPFGVFHFLLIIAKWVQYKPVKKESLMIMPAFGVQLEQHYWSGRVHRQFLPVSKILKPVLNECVSPVTCYWSLALLLRDEDELTLVFKKLHPPLKMLVPIWKPLCSFTNSDSISPSVVLRPDGLHKHIDQHGAPES